MNVYVVIYTTVDDVFPKSVHTDFDSAVKYLDEVEEHLREKENVNVVRESETSLYVEDWNGTYFIEESTLVDKNLNDIKDLTKTDKKDLFQKMCKLTEEVGELAGALLSNTQAHGSGYKNVSNDEVLGEFADVYLTLMSVFYEWNMFEDDDLQTKVKEKIEKWKLNQKRR